MLLRCLIWYSSRASLAVPASAKGDANSAAPSRAGVSTQVDSLAQRAEIQRQMSLAVTQQNRVVDMRINRALDKDVFASKQTELRDRIAGLNCNWTSWIARTMKCATWP